MLLDCKNICCVFGFSEIRPAVLKLCYMCCVAPRPSENVSGAKLLSAMAVEVLAPSTL